MRGEGSKITRPIGFALTVLGLLATSYSVALLLQQEPARAAVQADEGAELYAETCAACHQAAGEGIAGTFPPLAGNPAAADADYVEAVIRDGLSGPLEVLGESYDNAMPPVAGLTSDSDIAAVVAFVGGLAGGAAEPAQAPPPVEPPAEGDTDRGHDLFAGSDRLDNGGVACAACHTAGSVGNLGGYSLGPDLTDAFTKLGGEAGLTAWLGNPPSQTMIPIFADNPMTAAEVADLTAFLADAPTQDQPVDSVDVLLLTGIGGLVILIGGMAIAWRGMRQTYVQKLRSKR